MAGPELQTGGPPVGLASEAPVRVETAEGRGPDLADQIHEVRVEIEKVRAEVAELAGELRAEIAQLRVEMADFKSEMRAEMADFKMELRAEIADLRVERAGRPSGSEEKHASLAGFRILLCFAVDCTGGRARIDKPGSL